MRIYGLCGRKQSGKDTFAMFAQEMLRGMNVQKRALADPLKQFCMDYLSLQRSSCYGSDFDKNRWVSKWGLIFNERLAERYNKLFDDPISGREILQVVGTDVFRECFRSTFWLDIMLKKTIPECIAAGIEVLFITDVRFRNEVEGLKANGGKVIRICRDCHREEQILHPSEAEMASIQDSEFHRIVSADENTSLAALRAEVSRFLYDEELVGAQNEAD